MPGMMAQLRDLRGPHNHISGGTSAVVEALLHAYQHDFGLPDCHRRSITHALNAMSPHIPHMRPSKIEPGGYKLEWRFFSEEPDSDGWFFVYAQAEMSIRPAMGNEPRVRFNSESFDHLNVEIGHMPLVVSILDAMLSMAVSLRKSKPIDASAIAPITVGRDEPFDLRTIDGTKMEFGGKKKRTFFFRVEGKQLIVHDESGQKTLGTFLTFNQAVQACITGFPDS